MAALDLFTTNHSKDLLLGAPIENAAAVTPSDVSDLTYVTRAIWVGTLGNISFDTMSGDTVTLVGVQGFLPLRAARIRSTSTTATDIVALW